VPDFTTLYRFLQRLDRERILRGQNASSRLGRLDAVCACKCVKPCYSV
jgi:hypothetical protein